MFFYINYTLSEVVRLKKSSWITDHVLSVHHALSAHARDNWTSHVTFGAKRGERGSVERGWHAKCDFLVLQLSSMSYVMSLQKKSIPPNTINLLVLVPII